MKKFNCKIERGYGERAKLPAGNYVAKILGAKEVTNDFGNTNLVIRFDIAEGEHKDFFQTDYDNAAGEDKKWRGIMRLPIPKDESEEEAWKARTFGNNIWAVEASNSGYYWDWDEKTLKGKMVGVRFRNKEWKMNGKTGWTTECGELAAVDDVRSDKLKQMKDKPLKEGSVPNGFTQLVGSSAFPASPNVSTDDDDVPF